MKLLALDTATENCSAALLLGTRLLTREAQFARGHAEHILPMVDALLAEAGLGLAALTAIAFGRGPGSFTGVRLAASLAQGLAFGAELPVVPVSDLQALAQRGFDLDSSIERALVCHDARMQEVYWACFERRDGWAAPAGPEHVGPPQSVRPPTGAQLAGFGGGFAAYPRLRALEGITVDPAWERLLPRAAEIARLAAREAQAGGLLAPEAALPVYLRDTVARPSSS
jgi:tRNA threonylcarbamoyladenosine biosynthesis protein TsaB